MNHRGIHYGMKQSGPSSWRFTIFPKAQNGDKTVSTVDFATYPLAEAACRTEIDRGFDAVAPALAE